MGKQLDSDQIIKDGTGVVGLQQFQRFVRLAQHLMHLSHHAADRGFVHPGIRALRHQQLRFLQQFNSPPKPGLLFCLGTEGVVNVRGCKDNLKGMRVFPGRLFRL